MKTWGSGPPTPQLLRKCPADDFRPMKSWVVECHGFVTPMRNVMDSLAAYAHKRTHNANKLTTKKRDVYTHTFNSLLVEKCWYNKQRIEMYGIIYSSYSGRTVIVKPMLTSSVVSIRAPTDCTAPLTVELYLRCRLYTFTARLLDYTRCSQTHISLFQFQGPIVLQKNTFLTCNPSTKWTRAASGEPEGGRIEARSRVGPFPADLGVWGVSWAPSKIRVTRSPAGNTFWRISKVTERCLLHLYGGAEISGVDNAGMDKYEGCCRGGLCRSGQRWRKSARGGQWRSGFHGVEMSSCFTILAAWNDSSSYERRIYFVMHFYDALKWLIQISYSWRICKPPLLTRSSRCMHVRWWMMIIVRRSVLHVTLGGQGQSLGKNCPLDPT